MVTQVKLGDISIEVILKDIKNVHLSVYPPTGKVRISAPSHMNIDTIRVFAASKLGWIKKQQRKFREQERETQREYVNRESHYVWGKRYLLVVNESNHAPLVELKHNQMLLRVRPGTNELTKERIIAEWHRQQLKMAVPPIIAKWELLLGVKVERFHIQRMKTKWGSCNHDAHSIRLNCDLVKKPSEYLEYIVVHEMAHLLEPTHNKRFVALMDRFMPKWHFYRDHLNQLPVSHEDWEY
jgi:hypothetical protein